MPQFRHRCFVFASGVLESECLVVRETVIGKIATVLSWRVLRSEVQLYDDGFMEFGPAVHLRTGGADEPSLMM